MCRAAGLVAGHQLVSFFAIAIGLMFALLFSAIYLIPTDSDLGQIAQMYTARLAVFSPVFAGMLVTRVAGSAERTGSRKRRWMAFTAVWVTATAIRGIELKILNGAPIGWVSTFVLGGVEALIPAFVFSSAYSRTASIRSYLRTLAAPTGSWIWYVFALVAFPLIHLLGIAIAAMVGTAPETDTSASPGSVSFAFVVTLVSVFFFSGGINEESGWRGFAQKRLQARQSPLTANLVLWVLLLVWHIPNDVIQYAQGGYVMVRVLLYPFFTILLGFVYNRTNGSILAPAVLHSSMNAMNPLMGVLPITTAGNILLIGMAVGVVVFDRMWRRLPGDHPAVLGQEAAAP